MDLYAILRVPPDASAADIRRAYRALLRGHHPDLNHDGGAPAARSEDRATGDILDAYSVLGDSGRRAAYDRARSLTPPPDPPDPPGPVGPAAEQEGLGHRAVPEDRRQRVVPAGEPVYLGFGFLSPDAIRLEAPPSWW